MYIVITIAGDATSWWMNSDAATYPDASAVSAGLARGPVNVPVFYPIKGSLLISKDASVAILDVPPAVSWIPSGVQAPVATLYVEAGPTADISGYTLPVGTNLGDLARQITTAMADRTVTTVPISSRQGSGVAVLNGASLSFAVICPPPVP